MSYCLEIFLSGTPKATNQLLGRNYWAKHKNATDWKWAVKKAILQSGKAPEAPLTSVQLTLIRRSYRTLDYDGLVASMKPIVDGLVEAKILKNDTWKITGPWIVTQEYAKKGLENVYVKVEEK